jgi:hypothetical protein
MNCCRFSFRCDVSARAAPWASSISVMTEMAMSVFPGCAADGGEHLPCVLPLPLGSDQHTGIEDQSHEGGSSGSQWLSMAASTSWAKSASMTAVESSGSSAMHSEMVRRGRRVDHRHRQFTALDHDLRAGAHRARSPAKSLAASASEMWITLSAMARL